MMKKFLCCIVIFSFSKVYAQKLPNVQQVSLRAPKEVKIDGKATEWKNLQAYNNATDLFYTIANDDVNLYLTVKADKPRIIEKIIAVGVTFTINKSSVKDDNSINNKVVTYPLLDVSTGYSIVRAAGIKTDNIPNNLLRASKIMPTPQEADSLKIVANKLLTTGSKVIKVSGFAGLPDTISIFNEHGIVTGLDYNKDGTYTYELQIPLQLAGLTAKQVTPFSYNLKLRSRLEDKKPGTLIVTKYDKDGNTINPNQDLDATTDFWGVYTLAK